MNVYRLKQRLSELRPSIKYCKLGEVCTYERGKTISKKDTIPGDVPVIAGGMRPAYYHNASNREAGTIAVSGSGAYAGFVSYWDIPVFLSDSFSVHPSDVLDRRYLYYYLKNKQYQIYNLQRGSGVPHVYGKDLMELKIQIPPIEIQLEIVRMLDNITTLNAQLIDELESEIEARKKQYEYYRNKLLTFEESES